MKLISIILATRNRPDKIGNCLISILTNSLSDYEIIVVDQSDDNKSKAIIQEISSPLIRYFRMKKRGLSRAKNFGIKKARGKIVTFIDDDAIVSRDWLENIHQSFQENKLPRTKSPRYSRPLGSTSLFSRLFFSRGLKAPRYSNRLKNKKISVVCGQILPWKPEEHSGLHPSGISVFKKKRFFVAPPKHKQAIFWGSSLSIKQSVFKKIGFFKEWLGTGSIGIAAEDEEFVYRLLKNGGKVLLNPQIVVYHNKWLIGKEFRRQLARYACGFFAAFGYYAFRGDKTTQNYLLVFLKKRLQEWQREIKFCFKDFHPKYLLRLLLIDIPFELFHYMKGLAIAFYLALQNLS